MRPLIILVLTISLGAVPGISRAESPQGPSKSQERFIQASLVGGGLALITSAIIFESRNDETDTYWLEDGSGDHVHFTYESGADTTAMFWAGATFLVLAAVLELMPDGARVSDEFLTQKTGGSLRLESTALEGGSSGFGLAGSF